jgi:hypothetical protein
MLAQKPVKVGVGDPVAEVCFDGLINCPLPLTSTTDLKGAAMLIGYWATWASSCAKQVPRLNELHEKYGARGLLVLGVSSETMDEIKPWVAENKPKYVVVSDEGGVSAARNGSEGVPYLVLVNTEGKVAWKGHLVELTDAMIQGVLADSFCPFAPLDGPLAPAATLLQQGQKGKAIAQLQAIQQAGSLQGQQKGLCEFTAWRLTREADALMKSALALCEKKKAAEGAIALHDIAGRFDGTDQAMAAKQKLKEMAQDSTLKREVDAAAVVAKARWLESDKKYDDAWLQYKAALIYGRTRCEELAKQAMQDIDNKGLRGYRADCHDCVVAGKACAKHKKK